MTIAAARFIHALLRRQATSTSFFSVSRSFSSLGRGNFPVRALSQFLPFQNPYFSPIASPLEASFASFSCICLQFFTTRSSSSDDDQFLSDNTDGWEEEDEIEPEVGDGGAGGGVVLQGVPWGERALSIAQEVLVQFGDNLKLYAFKVMPREYIYVRLDKLTNEYGCPSMEELENYSQEYKKRLDEAGALGEIPDNLALEVSTPGADRILQVPDDVNRFKNMPMRVCYIEDKDSDFIQMMGVFLLDSLEKESESCIWKLADVKENRAPLSKGRPLSRKRRDWRLKLPFDMHKRVTLYLE